MYRLIRFYYIDATVLGTIYRIPWYALAEYILDQNDDGLTEALDEFIQSRYLPDLTLDFGYYLT